MPYARREQPWVVRLTDEELSVIIKVMDDEDLTEQEEEQASHIANVLRRQKSKMDDYRGNGSRYDDDNSDEYAERGSRRRSG